jgi:monofunctional biosynthetic peptidoglycan transglycosylase
VNLGVAAILVMLVSASSSAGPVLADFSDPAEIDQWTGVHDRVMGGVSEAVLVHVGDRAVFSGTVSTDFGGGFASVRRKPADLALDGEAGVRIRVRGDGKQYQLRLKPGDRLDGITWRALFVPGQAWQTLTLPFERFEPYFRGRPVPGAGPLDPSAVRQMGLMIADKQEGPFRLEIRLIEGLSDSGP